MDLICAVKAYIKKEDLIRPGQRLLAAVSGGVDSMCLAHILLALQEELHIQLAVAHFDHQLRPESAEEGRFVAAFAKANNIPFYSGGADILALGGNIEDTARRERYAFLRTTAAAIGAHSIVLAHHGDDQAETVLLHLLRGCGTAGLSGMSPAENDIIRPLLFARRRDIEEYAAAFGVEYREDSSNKDVRYLRNRIRHQLLPLLETYNPRIVKALNSTAEICRHEDILLEEMAANALAEGWLEEKGALDNDYFQALPLALRRRAARKACTLVGGEEKQPDFEQTEAVVELADGSCTSLPGELMAYRRGDIYFGRSIPPLPEHTEEAQILADGQWHELADWGWEYRAVPALGTALPEDMLSCVVSANDLPLLRFRTRRQGDKLISRGKKGEKKLKDLFINKRIPVYKRVCWPILSREKDILWVPGLWRDDRMTDRDKPLLIKLRVCGKI